MRKKVFVTVIIMIYKDDKILLQNRINKKTHGLSFIGGHVENDDSIILTAIREIKEETNLDVHSLKIVGVKEYFDKDDKYLSILLKTNDFDGELKSSDEGEVNWYNINKVQKSNNLSEHFLATLKVFRDEGLNELLILSNQESVTL